jgi:hypothetical protein
MVTAKAIFRHAVIGGLWRPIKKRAEQELVKDLKTKRFASFPFVSPDTFRAISSVVIEDGRVLRRPRMFHREVVYFELAEVAGTEQSFSDSIALMSLKRVLGECQPAPIVIMSHGDFIPDLSLLSRIGERSERVFAINLPVETDKIRAIPLGLENFSWNRNGRLADFLSQSQGMARNEKLHEVFASFAVRNNPQVRLPIAEALKDSSFYWSEKRLSPENYRARVRESKFVISPPGRGLDCHRTWEALYLGAVPVVQEGSLAPGLIDSLPILAVADYSEFFAKTSRERHEIYESLTSRGLEKAFMPYWLERISRVAVDTKPGT